MNKHLSLFVFSSFALGIFALLVLGSSTAHAARPQDYNLKEGDLISAVFSDDPDVYIINDYGYKRLFLNPEIFKFYAHLGGFASVKIVTPEIRDAFVTSGIFRDCENNDPKVYGIRTTGEDVATLNWVDTPGTQAVTDDPDFFKKVFCINNKEFSWYPKGSEFHSVREVPNYSRRRGTPTPTPFFTSTPVWTPYPTPVPTPVGALSFSQSALNFSYTQGGNVPANQQLIFTNTSNTTINFRISINNQPAWLNTSYSTDQLSAYPNQPVSVGASINPAGLNPGTYTTNIVITGNFSGSPLSIPITLTVAPVPTPTPTPTPIPSLTFTISNTTNWLRNPTFLSGDTFHMLAVTNMPSTAIKSCYTYNGSSGCDTGNYSTNSYGTWNSDSQVVGISLGNWTRWVEIGGVKSNIVSYTVIEAPRLYIYNLTEPSRNPVFSFGDGLRLAASGPANKNLKSCYTLSRNGSLVTTGCDPEGSFFSFNATGTWSVDTQVVGISAGSWTRWVEVDGVKSDIINYTVSQ